MIGEQRRERITRQLQEKQHEQRPTCQRAEYSQCPNGSSVWQGFPRAPSKLKLLAPFRMRRHTGLDESFSSSQCVQVGTCGPSTVTVAPTSALLSPVHNSWSLKGLPGWGVSSGPRPGERMVPSVCKRTGPSDAEGPGSERAKPTARRRGLPCPGSPHSGPAPASSRPGAGPRAAPSRLPLAGAHARPRERLRKFH